MIDESGGQFRRRVRWWSALAVAAVAGVEPGGGRGDAAEPGGGRRRRGAGGGGRDKRHTVLDLLDDESGERGAST